MRLPPLTTAAVVAVGSELLTPYRTDTNSLTITARLDEVGIRLVHKAVVGDREEDIALAIREAMQRADLIVLCGGLGPTADDLTRDAIASVFGLTLIEDAAIVEYIERRYARRGLPMPAINRRQALVPDGAESLHNPHGTAPGLLLERDDVTLMALPGPPRELGPMLDTVVAARLAARGAGTPLRRRVVRTTGRGESAVDEVAAPIYEPWTRAPLPIETTVLASPGHVELHLSCRSDDVEAADAALDAAAIALEEALAPACYSRDGRTLEQVVGDLLAERGLTVAPAESCTGGLVTGRLTEVPGSSAWLRGAIVAYDNQVKIEQLRVPAGLLAEHGAVSEPVARAMADGARAALGADVGVAVTGIAGPGGGTPAKPVGTVVVAASGLGRSRLRTFLFSGDRKLVREQSVQAALDAVRRLVLDL